MIGRSSTACTAETVFCTAAYRADAHRAVIGRSSTACTAEAVICTAEAVFFTAAYRGDARRHPLNQIGNLAYRMVTDSVHSDVAVFIRLTWR